MQITEQQLQRVLAHTRTYGLRFESIATRCGIHGGITIEALKVLERRGLVERLSQDQCDLNWYFRRTSRPAG